LILTISLLTLTSISLRAESSFISSSIDFIGISLAASTILLFPLDIFVSDGLLTSMA
jgi:hypothetical protein